MKAMKNKLESVLEDWRVYDCEERGGCYEVESWSPAGEDVVIVIRGATLAELAEDAKEAWEYFDAEEHASEILVAKRSGNEHAKRFYAAAPDSLRELLEDAEAIKAMYQQVYERLLASAGAEGTGKTDKKGNKQ